MEVIEGRPMEEQLPAGADVLYRRAGDASFGDAAILLEIHGAVLVTQDPVCAVGLDEQIVKARLKIELASELACGIAQYVDLDPGLDVIGIRSDVAGDVSAVGLRHEIQPRAVL